MIAVEALRLKINELDSRLTSNLPDYKIILAEIHKTLRDDAELTHILSVEELAVIFAAMKQYKNIEIPITEKKAKNNNIPRGPVNLEDF